jgi:monovalent cation/proton antiporter MnhG/PhaG subunit
VILEAVLSSVGAVFLVSGLALATVGLIGLILKPDLFDQLHAAGLVTGPGVILVLLASVGTGRAEIITSALLVIGFILVTSSISTHVIAHAGVRRYRAAPRDGSAMVGAESATGDRRPVMGMRVVLAYDGSPESRVAAALAAGIDWPAGTIVRLITVADGPPPSILEELASAAETIGRPAITVETTVRPGDPTDVVTDETAVFEADLLMTGSRRRGVVQSVLGASAAGDIVDRAPCPVLVARSPTLRAVMVTTDGSSESGVAADLVARWPIFDLARIYVATVATDPTIDGAADQRLVDLTAAGLLDAGREVVTEILHGRPGPAIVDAADRRSVDLIVVGSRGRTGLGRTLLGSVAGDILASASSSVMIVRPRRRRPASGV